MKTNEDQWCGLDDAMKLVLANVRVKKAKSRTSAKRPPAPCAELKEAA